MSIWTICALINPERCPFRTMFAFLRPICVLLSAQYALLILLSAFFQSVSVTIWGWELIDKWSNWLSGRWRMANNKIMIHRYIIISDLIIEMKTRSVKIIRNGLQNKCICMTQFWTSSFFLWTHHVTITSLTWSCIRVITLRCQTLKMASKVCRFCR